MHRIFCAELPAEGGNFTPDRREAEHLFKVFRAAPGDPVELLDGHGGIASAHVIPGKMLAIDALRQIPPPAEKIHLCCALPRRQKMDQMLRQAAELGAWTIRPLRCERSVAEGGPRERWDLLLQEACKQSGNPFLPQILPETSLSEMVDEVTQKGIFSCFGSVAPAPLEFGRFSGREKAVFIGPEGGFSPAEIARMQQAGVKPLNLGPHILRIETAALAALTVLRLLLFLLVSGVFFFFASGCTPKDLSKNPLLVKAEKLRQSGDAEAARRHLRQAVARYPEHPDPYYALAKLCDEEAADPWEAIYCYRSFLQLAPPDDPRRATAETMIETHRRTLAASLKPAGKETAEAEIRKLQEENRELLRRNRLLQQEAIRLHTLLRQKGQKTATRTQPQTPLKGGRP